MSGVRTARPRAHRMGDGRQAPASRAPAADSAVRNLTESVARALALTQGGALRPANAVCKLKLRRRCSARAIALRDWLIIDAEVPERIGRRVCHAGGPFGLLRMNRALSGPARIVLADGAFACNDTSPADDACEPGARPYGAPHDPHRLALRLRADVPLVDVAGEARDADADAAVGVDLDTRAGHSDSLVDHDVRDACVSVTRAFGSECRRRDCESDDSARVRDDCSDDANRRSAEGVRDGDSNRRGKAAGDRIEPNDPDCDDESHRTGPPATVERLVELCNDLGWTYAGTDGSELRITLDAPEAGFRQAFLRPAGNGARVVLDFYDDLPEPPAPLTADAIALLLLRVGGTSRLVRPCASKRCAEIGFDVRLPRLSTALLDHALSALSVAARVCACEVDALAADHRLAEAYAAAHGLDS